MRNWTPPPPRDHAGLWRSAPFLDEPTAKMMDAVITLRGFRLHPWAHARVTRRGTRVRLTWRRRATRETLTLTLRLPAGMPCA